MRYTQRNLFEILLNQPEIRLYLIRFRKDFSVCKQTICEPALFVIDRLNETNNGGLIESTP